MLRAIAVPVPDVSANAGADAGCCADAGTDTEFTVDIGVDIVFSDVAAE